MSALRKSILVSALVLAVSGAGFGLSTWHDQKQNVGAASAGDTVVVTKTPFTRHVSLAGLVTPDRYHVVIAPFDGTIEARSVQYGQQVTAGSELLRLSTDEISARIREAELANIKAEAAVRQLRDWTNSPDVSRARRAHHQIKAALAALERQLSDARDLLNRGIVSRNEVQTIEQQRESQIASLKASEEDLAAVIERGNSENRRLADLELQATSSRLAELRSQSAGSSVAAPVDGIVFRTPESASTASLSLDPGARLTRGQPMVRIAESGKLNITGKVDERDSVSLKRGMPARIVIEAMPSQLLAGEITSVGMEATPQTGGQAAGFDVVVAISGLDATQLRLIRIGMSAKVSIETYRNDAAIVVPIEAVRDWTTGPHVFVREPVTQTARRVPVTLGAASADGVEVSSGLKPGDAVVRNGQP
jgi:HlyD family secretion protein